MCPSFQLRNTVHVHSHNKPLIFTVDMDKLPTVPFFLSSLFPVPHCITTRIICLKCKFDHSILLLQNGFSPMASQSYVGFRDHPRPASSLRQPLWFLGLSLSALHSQGTSTGTLSPPWCFTHRPLCLEFSLLSRIPPAVWSACGNSLSSWKTQVFIQEAFSGLPNRDELFSPVSLHGDTCGLPYTIVATVCSDQFQFYHSFSKYGPKNKGLNNVCLRKAPMPCSHFQQASSGTKVSQPLASRAGVTDW